MPASRSWVTALAEPGVLACFGCLAVSVAALVSAERNDTTWLRRVSKPFASTAFVALGLALGAAESRYGRAVLAALVLGCVGDTCLLGKGKAAFLAGLGAFLLGHLAFGYAFLLRGVHVVAALVTLGVLVWPFAALFRWLSPDVPASLKGPVGAYFAVIAAMITLAVGTAWASPGWLVAGGALAFAGSDVSVARDRFKGAGWTNRAWGLPLYYAAQCMLALSIVRVS